VDAHDGLDQQVVRNAHLFALTSFRELLTKVRMHEARWLLARDGTPIQEVAARVGYREPAQFSKRFRHHYGVSPRAYREASGATFGAVEWRFGSPSIVSVKSSAELRPREVDECPM
jgi:AraC-like DNA-binding protein